VTNNDFLASGESGGNRMANTKSVPTRLPTRGFNGASFALKSSSSDTHSNDRTRSSGKGFPVDMYLNEARKEVKQCYRYILRGKNTGQRISRTVDVLLDHKAVLAVGVVGVFGLSVLNAPNHGAIGSQVANAARRAETARWGSRAIR
jgi:hypothetical protein